MRLLRYYLQALDLLWPAKAARLTYHFMSNPQVHKLRPFEQEVLAQAQAGHIDFQGFRLQTYQWGDAQAPVALLVHGWEGQAGNFGALVPLLLQKGYQVVGADGPAHGHSSKGETSMFQYAEVGAMLYERFRPQLLISHSFGSIAALSALLSHPGLSVRQWLIITTPSSFRNRVEQVGSWLGVSHRTVERILQLVATRTGHDPEELNITRMGADLRNVADVLIVHSKADRILPLSDAHIALASFPHARLEVLEGVGHYAILWSEALQEVVKRETPQAQLAQPSR